MTIHHSNHTRFSFDLPVVDHKKLKAMAALAGVSLKDLILGCLKDNLLSENIPNEETIRVFKETDEGKNLVSCDDFNDLVNKLGLK